MDSAWLTFMFQLGYKAEEAGMPMVKVDPSVNIKHLGWRCADNPGGRTMDLQGSCGES